jgi:hypothetical protein
VLNVVIAEVKRFNCPLLFVKDHGVYVMAAKGEKNSNGMHNVCYANGFNPDTTDFDELWDRMRDACGGDDFCESLDLDPRSIELLSRTKPCRKLCFQRRNWKLLQGTEINHKKPVKSGFLYFSTVFTSRTKCPIIYLWPGMVLRSPNEGNI